MTDFYGCAILCIKLILTVTLLVIIVGDDGECCFQETKEDSDTKTERGIFIVPLF